MKRIFAVGLVLIILGSTLGTAPVTAQSQAVFLSVQTSTTPDQPTSGDEFDLQVTVTSADAGTNNAYINRLSLVNATTGDKERYETDYSIGQVSPGHALSHTLEDVELAEEGVYDLFIDMTVTAGGRTFHVYEPVTIVVYDGHPIVDASAQVATAGSFTNLSVDVANGLDQSVRNVEVTLESQTVSIEQPRRVASVIEAGATRGFSFRAKSPSPGDKDIDATIWYTDADGERRHVTRTVSTTFAEPEYADDVKIAADVAPTLPGSQTTLNVTVSNGLDVALRQLQLTVSGADVSIPQPERVDGQIASGETRTYTYRVTKQASGAQQFRADVTYITADGNTRTVSKTLETAFIEPTNPGEVSLTGLQVEQDGDSLVVSGTASNIGGGAVSGVTVAVGSNDAIVPGQSQAEYFVGSIPASDFASFDVNAQLQSNTSSVAIPLIVTYTIDDVRQQTELTVQYEPEQQHAEAANGGGLPLGTIIGVLVVVLVLGAVGYYWRRR